MATKMKILFDGFEDLANDISRSMGDHYLHMAVDDALVKTQTKIQENLRTAAAPYATKGKKGYATGKMYKSIIHNGQVTWQGSKASVDVGFRLRQGGWSSIFIMYGTPRITKDTKVYNAIKGTKTKKEIAELQEETMYKYLQLGEKK